MSTSTTTTAINLDSTKSLQHHSFTLFSTSNFYPPFTIIPPASSSQPQHTVDIRNKRKIMYSLDHNRDRNRLSIDTFSSVIERETLYSRASHVASILRSLGPTNDDREQGISALCNYVEGKRSKGKNDEEIRKKISILEGMVPPDLGDIFVKASLRSGLARKTTLSLLPTTSTPISLRPLRPLHRSRLSLASLSSISSSNSNLSLPPLPPIPPPSAPIPLLEETSNEGFLGSFTHPHPHYQGNPSSPTSSLSERFNHSSIISNSSLGRAPTLLSPLAIGGWGRQWEKPLLNRSSNLSISSSSSSSPNPHPPQDQRQEGQKKLFDGISLDIFAFPNPPDHLPSPSDSVEDPSDEMYIKGCLSSTSSISAQNMGGHDDMMDLTAVRLKLAEKERGLDQSWLSISDDNSSCGLPSATLGEDPYHHERGEEERNGMNELGRLGLGFGFGFSFDDQDQRTVTGIESSSWSAIVSNRDEKSSNEYHKETITKGPTEASLIRDAYLKMIKPPKLIQIPVPGPGPEQGDSHTILMAYAQPQPTTACSA